MSVITARALFTWTHARPARPGLTAHTPHPVADVLGLEQPDDDEIYWYGWPWHGGRVLTLNELRQLPLLPLRRLSGAEHARVKSYRRQSREGVLPPVLAWWISGLFALVVVDGHDRLVAAMAEKQAPRIVTFGLAVRDDVVEAEASRAVRNYATTVAHTRRRGAIETADRSLTATVTAAGHRFGPTRAFASRGEPIRTRRGPEHLS